MVPITVDTNPQTRPQVGMVTPLSVVMDLPQVVTVRPAQLMDRQVMHTAQIMQIPGKTVLQCMCQTHQAIKSPIIVATLEVNMPPTVVVVAMAR